MTREGDCMVSCMACMEPLEELCHSIQSIYIHHRSSGHPASSIRDMSSFMLPTLAHDETV
jgi:hypothetical protein